MERSTDLRSIPRETRQRDSEVRGGRIFDKGDGSPGMGVGLD